MSRGQYLQVILTTLALGFILSNLMSAMTQTFYAIQDHAPTASILATFWWHLIHGV